MTSRVATQANLPKRPLQVNCSLEEAMTLVSSCAAALLSLALSGPQAPLFDGCRSHGGERRVLVDTALQRVVAFSGDEVVQVSRVSTGRPGHETPRGVFGVQYRYPAPVSSSYMVRMPHWICIDDLGQLGLHECQPQHYRQLGTPGSHGCIRLGPSTAEWLYGWLPDGAEVRIR